VTAAIGWGVLAASSLVVGALLGLAREWPDRLIGIPDDVRKGGDVSGLVTVLGFALAAGLSAVS
jgi:hypothetical protein